MPTVPIGFELLLQHRELARRLLDIEAAAVHHGDPG
jgi:hypothetical protein